MTHRANELPDPQEKFPETQNPPAASTDLPLGSNVAQQATGPFPNISLRALAVVPLWMKALMPLHSAYAPAGGAVGARDFFDGLEQLDPRAAEAAIRLGQENRKQIGVKQGLRNLVGQPAEALRR